MIDLPRCDYKEFLELAKVISGESVEWKEGYICKLQRPEANFRSSNLSD
jgi:hypothetical protein